jgi:hypothetical protein
MWLLAIEHHIYAMKKLTIATLICCSALAAGAKQPGTGYRGFIDADYALFKHNAPGFARQHAHHAGISTTHGYQIIPQLFVGAGIGIENNTYTSNFYFPVFADVRTDLQFGRFTPYADMRLGWTLASDGGFLWQPTVGYRFNWGRTFAINLGVGCYLQCVKYNYYNFDYDKWDWQNPGYDHGDITVSHRVETGLMVRLGIEF